MDNPAGRHPVEGNRAVGPRVARRPDRGRGRTAGQAPHVSCSAAPRKGSRATTLALSSSCRLRHAGRGELRRPGVSHGALAPVRVNEKVSTTDGIDLRRAALEHVLTTLGVAAQVGLADVEAEPRLRRFGPNEVPERRPHPVYFGGTAVRSRLMTSATARPSNRSCRTTCRSWACSAWRTSSASCARPSSCTPRSSDDAELQQGVRAEDEGA